MKITHVESFRVSVPAADPPFRWRDGLAGSAPAGEGGVLRIGTDAGVEGVAFFSRPGAAVVLDDLVERVFRPELLGQDPLRREWLWHRVWELDRIHELPLPTLGLIDVALWDLAGRLHGEPTWRVLGGFRTEIPAYASTTTFGSIDEYFDVADQCLALGYRGVKLHAWGAQAFAAPVDQLVPASTLQGFATGSLAPCQVDGHTYCLRNDIAQVVLWYNKKLMDQWGYQVPATWEQYQALGEKVAAQHPGYVVGAVGDTNSQESYFWSSRCPAQQLVANNTLKVDLTSPDCTRMASLLDPLIADKAVSTLGFFTQGFDGSKVLMAVGPSWYGQYLFNSAFKTPAGQIAAAAPLTWDGESTTATGNVGGGVWMISSHSTNLKAAEALATWLTTSTENLQDAPTYPAYVAGAKAWLVNPANKDYFADDVAPVFLAAANEVWTGWSNTKFSDATPWSSAVLPALTAGKSLSEVLPAWQTAIANQARSVGYTVVTK